MHGPALLTCIDPRSGDNFRRHLLSPPTATPASPSFSEAAPEFLLKTNRRRDAIHWQTARRCPSCCGPDLLTRRETVCSDDSPLTPTPPVGPTAS